MTKFQPTHVVEAKQLTLINALDVEEWCGGTIARNEDHALLYVPSGANKASVANEGDWVVKDQYVDDYSVFSDHDFHELYPEVAKWQSE